jgi:alkylated DNA repair protein alkB homolog 1
MPAPLNFNPHESPPQELKDIFKSWKGQLTSERDQYVSENVPDMPRLESIPHDCLVDALGRFSRDDDTNDPDITEQVALHSSGSIYSSQKIPGMRASFIARQGRAVIKFFRL